MKTMIEVEVKETVIPAYWHTAAECREIAESWENNELRSCMDTLLSAIWQEANRGGVSLSHSIYTNRPAHFYEVLREKMETLGFQVEPPACPSDTSCFSRWWKFKW